MNQKKIFSALFFILVLNIFLKFYYIGESSIWLDEAYSVNEAKYTTSEIIVHSSYSDNPPLYYLLLHWWTDLFGFSETGIRSLSAVCSILAACFIFIFANRIFGYEAGFISSVLFSLSTQNLYYAQETRTYALVTMLTALSIGFYFLMQKHRSKSAFVGLTISNILLIYSHYLSICIPVLQLITALIFFKNDRVFAKRNILSVLFVFIAFLPWAHVPLSNKPKEGSFWLDKPTFANVKGVFIEIANNKVMLVASALIVIFFLLRVYRNQKSITSVFSMTNVALVAFYFLPVVILFIVSYIVPVFLLRYLLFISIPFYLLVGIGISGISQNKIIKYGLAGLLIITSIISLELHPAKQEDWKNAIAYVKAVRGRQQPIILSATYTESAFSYYYDQRVFMLKDSIRTNQLLSEKVYPKSKTTFEELQKMLDHQPVIGIFSHETDQDPDNTLMDNLSKLFLLKEVRQFGKVKVCVYQ